jgi:hypothetical protein
METAHKSFATPDETRDFPNGRAEILSIEENQVGRLIFQPGWRWSTDVKPLAGTVSCEAPHFQYHVSGRLAIRMDAARSSSPSRATLRPCRRVTTPGSWATSRWWS